MLTEKTFKDRKKNSERNSVYNSAVYDMDMEGDVHFENI